MNDYILLRTDIRPASETATDIMAAMLADVGFESFVPDSDGLDAYIKEELYDADAVRAIADSFPMPDTTITTTTTRVEGQDWNHEWEKNYFKPIVVADRCVIHSSFHTDYPKCEYDISIDPKMAFGTGHHATTSQIISALLSLDLTGKAVTDMGTGTGILAILSAMRGATPVSAIEIDPAAEINARENVASNGHPEINVLLGDAARLADVPKADVFIANINRNIITGDLHNYVKAMKPGATMLLSGFYESDIPVIMATASPLGLTEHSHTVKGDGWTCLRLTYNP